MPAVLTKEMFCWKCGGTQWSYALRGEVTRAVCSKCGRRVVFGPRKKGQALK